MKYSLLLVVLLLTGACGPRKPVVTTVYVTDAGELDEPALVCLSFRRQGCEEGWGFNRNGSCEAVVRKLIGSRITLIRTQCIIGAQSKDDVRACGEECR